MRSRRPPPPPAATVLWSSPALPPLPRATTTPTAPPQKKQQTLLVDASAFIWAHFQSTGVSTPQEMLRDMAQWSRTQLLLDSNSNIQYGAWVLDSLGAGERKQRQLASPPPPPPQPPRRDMSTSTPFEYKGWEEQQRRRLPDIVRTTNELLHAQQQLLGGLRIVSRRATEADDVIASLVPVCLAFSQRVTICSPDKDFFQLLLSPQQVVVRRAFYHGAEKEEMTVERFKQRYRGVLPEQYCDLAALCTVMEEKHACALLRRHRDVESALSFASSASSSTSSKDKYNHRVRAAALWEKRACQLDSTLNIPLPLGQSSTWEAALAVNKLL